MASCGSAANAQLMNYYNALSKYAVFAKDTIKTTNPQGVLGSIGYGTKIGSWTGAADTANGSSQDYGEALAALDLIFRYDFAFDTVTSADTLRGGMQVFEGSTLSGTWVLSDRNLINDPVVLRCTQSVTISSDFQINKISQFSVPFIILVDGQIVLQVSTLPNTILVTSQGFNLPNGSNGFSIASKKTVGAAGGGSNSVGNPRIAACLYNCTFTPNDLNYFAPDCNLISRSGFEPMYNDECAGSSISRVGLWHDIFPLPIPVSYNDRTNYSSSADFFFDGQCNINFGFPDNLVGHQHPYVSCRCSQPPASPAASVAPVQFQPECKSGYAGIQTFNMNSSVTLDQNNMAIRKRQREYIGQHITPLEVAKHYYIACHASLADNSTHASNVEILLSNGSPAQVNAGAAQSLWSHCRQGNPQASQYVTDKESWVKVSDVFEATSSFDELTIGIFTRPHLGIFTETTYSQTVQVVPHTPSNIGYAYYYIDNVQLIKLPEAGSDRSTSCYQEVQIGQSVACSGLGCELSNVTYKWTFLTGSTYVAIPTSNISNPNISNPLVNVGQTTTFRMTVYLDGTIKYTDDVIVLVTPNSSDPINAKRVTPSIADHNGQRGVSLNIPISVPGEIYSFSLYKLNYKQPLQPITLMATQNSQFSHKQLTEDGKYRILQTNTYSGCKSAIEFFVLGIPTSDQTATLYSNLNYNGPSNDVVVVGDITLKNKVRFSGGVNVWVDGTNVPIFFDCSPGASTSTKPSITGYKITVRKESSSGGGVGLTINDANIRGIAGMWKGFFIERDAKIDFSNCTQCTIADAEFAIQAPFDDSPGGIGGPGDGDFGENPGIENGGFGDLEGELEPGGGLNGTGFTRALIQNTTFANCLNGVKYNIPFGSLLINNCKFETKPAEMKAPYISYYFQSAGACTYTPSRDRIYGEYAIVSENELGSLLSLTNTEISGFYIGILATRGTDIGIENSRLAGIVYSVVANQSAATITSSTFSLGKLGTLSFTDGPGQTIINSTFSADRTLLGGWQEPIYGFYESHIRNQQWGRGWAGILGTNYLSPITSVRPGLFTLQGCTFTSSSGSRGVLVQSPQTGKVSILGNSFSGFSQALTVGGPQVNSLEIKENRFAYNATNIILPYNFVQAQMPNTNNPSFILKCNDFVFQPGFPSVGVAIEDGASVSDIGSCSNRNGNAWPYILDVSTSTWATPAGWAGILSNSAINYHAFRNEFFSNPQLSNVTDVRTCVNSPAEDWRNNPASDEEGCFNLDPIVYTYTRSGLTSTMTDLDDQLTIAPNPNAGEFKILCRADEIPLDITIYNCHGSLVHKQMLKGADIDLKLPSGMYRAFVSISNGKRLSTNVIIIK